ncbi:MAG: metallophosphoesterase [Nitrososphaerota archaeon]|nr:metallophosphoesterase [Nitrososphaerota archaeon]MDG6927361.1 metallophosphoesterase [Nitrososphaerota archaeon]MDG6930911.1 metallophosphoesterase [Nitrososphaerota archaeon]MDG6932211.1 metallophosphoesterase [Nitrososphaerota archaeon]MDG6935796.1 metallophosphoesterase [Nitrososphaerota archaeon]
MEIISNVFSVPGHRGVYFRDLDLLAVSDLQLGEERVLAEESKIYLPEVQIKLVIEEIRKMHELTGAGRLLINGDFKHGFSGASRQEWLEVQKVYEESKALYRDVIVVRGNHDNYLSNISTLLGFNLSDEYFEAGYKFVHGHKLTSLNGVRTLVIGHEQPAILLRKGFDSVKMPAILYGKAVSEINFICLPALSPISSGVAVNAIGKKELLSPYFKSVVDVDELNVIAIDPDAGEVPLPRVGILRQFLRDTTGR